MNSLLFAWRRHQMGTFSVLLVICAGNSSVAAEFPAQRLVTWSFDVFFDLRLNKRLSKQSLGWWCETLSRPLWRHCNGSEYQWPCRWLCRWRFYYMCMYHHQLNTVFNPRPLRPKGYCRHLRLSVCPSVCLSVPIILVNTITQSVYPISPPNLLDGFNVALSWMVL